VLVDQLVWGYLDLRLAERYQIGKSAKKEKEGQYYVGQSP